MAQIQLRDISSRPLSLINIRLSLGNKSSDEAYDDKFTDYSGNTAWPNPLPSSSGYTLHVNYNNVNPLYESKSVFVQKLVDVDIPLTLLGKIQRVRVDGLDFRTVDDNQIFKVNGATNFLLFQRFMEEQDIDSVLYPGPTMYRFTMTMKIVPNSIGMKDLTPESYGAKLYWDTLDSFCNYLVANGKYGEATLFCDLEQLGRRDDNNWQQSMFNQAIEVLKPKNNIFFSLGNEWQKNGFKPSNFSRPSGIISSSGSNIVEVVPTTPGWDYTEIHPRRDLPKHLKNCESTELQYASLTQPVSINEPFGADEVYIPNKRYNDPRMFSALRKLMDSCNGGDFHSTAGVTSSPLGPVQAQCLDAYNQAG